MEFINKLKFSLICGLIISSSFSSVLANKILTTKKGDKDVGAKVVKEEEGEIKSEKKPVYYELIHEMLRPDSDEFYLSTIYGTPKNPRALIKRSQNMRAGELYTGNVEYGLGENIADDLVIVEINFEQREVVVQDTKTKDYYGLKLSYGNAVSRLVKKPNYIPLVSDKKEDSKTEEQAVELKNEKLEELKDKS